MSRANPLATVEQFLSRVSKTAEANTEPGSIGGPTTHPTKDVDDGTEKGKTGARAAENAKDVKKDQGPPAVDATADATAKVGDDKKVGEGTAASDQLQIGLKQSPTGGDPSIETASAKAGKNDPGSSHPARTDNDALGGGKYAGDIQGMELTKLAQLIGSTGNNIALALNDAIKGACDGPGGDMKPVGGKPAKKEEAKKEEKKVVEPPVKAGSAQIAENAGWSLVGLLDGSMDKQAADAMVTDTVEEIIKLAMADADRVSTYLTGYYQTKAADGPPDGGPGGPPPGGPPDGGPGGPPPGGDPSGGAGGPPPGGPGGDPSGGGGEATLAQILTLLQQLPPEELQQLEQALASELGGGGGAGGPPPGGPGGPPPGPGGPPPGPAGAGAPGGPGMEVSAMDEATKKASLQYLTEVIQRSRAKSARAA